AQAKARAAGATADGLRSTSACAGSQRTRRRSQAARVRPRAFRQAPDLGVAKLSGSWFQPLSCEFVAQVLEPAHESHSARLLARFRLLPELGEAPALQKPPDDHTTLPLGHGGEAGRKGRGNLVAVLGGYRGRLGNQFERNRPKAMPSPRLVSKPAPGDCVQPGERWLVGASAGQSCRRVDVHLLCHVLGVLDRADSASSKTQDLLITVGQDSALRAHHPPYRRQGPQTYRRRTARAS